MYYKAFGNNCLLSLPTPEMKGVWMVRALAFEWVVRVLNSHKHIEVLMKGQIPSRSLLKFKVFAILDSHKHT